MTLTLLLALVLAAIFAALSAIHVYWAFRDGGDLGGAVPEKDGQPLFRPGPGSCLAVALALALAAGFCLAQGGLVPWVPAALARLGVWVLVAVFTLRAIGDFRYVGFFKRVRGTRFAKLDTRYFSPLCLLLAGLALGLVLQP